MRQPEGGGFIAPTYKYLVDMSKKKYLLMNNRKIRDNLKEVESYQPKMAPPLIKLLPQHMVQFQWIILMIH